jgi:hypothetical protein
MPLLPTDTPRLPKWPFIIGDAALLGLAVLIGFYAHNPFAGKPLILIVVCVALGAVLACIPFITDYAHQQDEALDERQRGLEALARTITSSAEQISIAAQSLPGIAEISAKNLKLAEQLPARLQEKIGEVKQCLAEVSIARSEPSATGHTTPQASESDRLEPIAGQIRKAAAELVKTEAIALKNLATARDELDLKAAQIFKQLDAKISALATLAEKISAGTTSLTVETPAPVRISPVKIHETPPVEPARSEPAERVESAAISPATAEKTGMVEVIALETPAEDPKSPRKRAPKKTKAESPEPALDFVASAESTAPRPARSAGQQNESVETAPSSSPSSPVLTAPAATGGDEFSQPSPDETAPASALSADGATRLLVTAYIGIGNKLFLRGEGSGLSWKEGVPLQFVSIGKWRWETADATAPIRAKLYKNDDVECTALGEITLDPGRQAEVTAAF